MKHLCLLFILFVSPAAAQNLRLGFPQIAVGGEFTTSIDLTNKGIETFRGSLAVVDDEGFFLPVQINGLIVDDFFILELSPNEIARFTLRSSGPLTTGHVIVWDMLPENAPDFRSQISGTAVFRIGAGSQLTDSIGVPQAIIREHFFFPAENGAARTGLALSNPTGDEITVTLRVVSPQNRLVDIETEALGPFEHRAFFIDEIADIPGVFRGTVEVAANLGVFALALRQEGSQLSTVTVRGMPVFYDFEITAGFQNLTGEMSFSVEETRITGVFRFDNFTLDNGFGGLTGVAGNGAAIVSMLGSSFGRDVTGYFGSTSFRTSDNSFTAPVVWDGSVGTIVATRKQP